MQNQKYSNCMNETKNNFWKYGIIIISVLLVAGLGTIFVNLGLDWFKGLNKPSFFVPSWVFGVVWTIIYGAFAVIVSLWARKENLKKSTLDLLIINGALNVVWCLLFFTLNNPILGLVTIIVNLIFSYLLIFNIYENKPIYSYILSIYPLWISIATALNLALWILN